MDDENKRIDIEDLPRTEEELTDEEAQNVEGGAGLYRFFGMRMGMRQKATPSAARLLAMFLNPSNLKS